VGAIGAGTGAGMGGAAGLLVGVSGALVGVTGLLVGVSGVLVGVTGRIVGAPGAAAWISIAEIFALSLLAVKIMVNNPVTPTLTVTDRVYAASLPTC
jgi:hypothetical protein